MKLKTISDDRGHLTVIERLPFDIKRVYYLHGIDTKAKRGGHAHKRLQRLMIALNGTFTVDMDGEKFDLCSAELGLYIPPKTWIELSDFTAGAVCLVLASLEHSESDCIRSREEFDRIMRLKPRSECDCLQGRVSCSCELSA